MRPTILWVLCLFLISCKDASVDAYKENKPELLYFDAGETVKTLVGYEAYYVDVAAYDFYNKRLWLDAKFFELNRRLIIEAGRKEGMSHQSAAKIVAAITAFNGLFSVVMSEAEKRSVERLINTIKQGNESARQAALRSFTELEVRRIGDFKSLAGSQVYKTFKSKLKKQQVSFRRTKKIFEASKISGVLGALGTATLATYEALSINFNSLGPIIPKAEFENWLHQTETINRTLDDEYMALNLTQETIKREDSIDAAKN